MLYSWQRRRGAGSPSLPKHGNKKIVLPDGQKFDSKREYDRYCQLQLEERAGAISGLCRQIYFVLAPAVKLSGKTKPSLRYQADFVYMRGGQKVVEDAKSPHLRKDPYYRAKKHLMMHIHNIEIQEV